MGSKHSKVDLLRPTKRQSLETLTRSRRTWNALLSASSSSTHFPQSCNYTSGLLHQTPAIPDGSSIDDIVEGSALFLEGYSEWGIGSSTRCDLALEPKISRTQKVIIGVAHPTFCSLSDDLLPDWVGFEPLSSDTSSCNYVCALALGWSYILSARLIELRKKTDEDEVSYTDIEAPWYTDDTTTPEVFVVPIGHVDANEYRWWAAILAEGCGWRAVLSRSGKVYYPSWECHLDHKERLNIRLERPAVLSPSPTRPPSSSEAYQYLLNFATLHNAHDQLVAAFAASLTIPSHLRFGAPVLLPKPKPMASTRASESKYRASIPPTDQLPHFMSLTCIPNVVSACISSYFWEPGVACNLAGEWLHPILQEILPPLLREKTHQVVIGIMAARRPTSAPLWLGSALTGMLPRITSVLSSYMPPACPETTAWTNAPPLLPRPKLPRNAALARNQLDHPPRPRIPALVRDGCPIRAVRFAAAESVSAVWRCRLAADGA